MYKYLFSCGVLADEYKEDEAAPEKVDASNDPEDKLRRGDTIHVPMISMKKAMNTFKYPQDAHHSEQLAVQKLQMVGWIYLIFMWLDYYQLLL